MILPNGLRGVAIDEAHKVPSGAFVIFTENSPRYVFFVSIRGDMQGFFAVKKDGTVDRQFEILDLVEAHGRPGAFSPVEAFGGDDIPGLKIRRGKIVWDNEELDKKPTRKHAK